MSTFANSEDPDEMQSTLFVKVNKIFRQKNTIFFLKLQPNTPRYVQWTITSLLYKTRMKNQLV